VQWDSGFVGTYRWGADNAFDILPVAMTLDDVRQAVVWAAGDSALVSTLLSLPYATAQHKDLMPGTCVTAGRDWRWGAQVRRSPRAPTAVELTPAQHKGELGIVMRVARWRDVAAATLHLLHLNVHAPDAEERFGPAEAAAAAGAAGSDGLPLPDCVIVQWSKAWANVYPIGVASEIQITIAVPVRVTWLVRFDTDDVSYPFLRAADSDGANRRPCYPQPVQLAVPAAGTPPYVVLATAVVLTSRSPTATGEWSAGCGLCGWLTPTLAPVSPWWLRWCGRTRSALACTYATRCGLSSSFLLDRPLCRVMCDCAIPVACRGLAVDCVRRCAESGGDRHGCTPRPAVELWPRRTRSPRLVCFFVIRILMRMCS
jgi:hypothetical protein